MRAASTSPSAPLPSASLSSSISSATVSGDGRGPGQAPGVAGALALVADELRRVEAGLAARMDSPIGRIPEVGAHLLQAGGKRLRPLLAVLAARATEAPLDLAVAVGVAGELIHTATLYHDDVVDDGRVRRGRPAARMVYGNGIVVLVGDFCLARALETVALTGSLVAVQSLAATVTEMAEGEVAQLERAGNPDATIDDYFRVIDRKTASLISWCARVAGGAGVRFDAALERYGRALGRAFQIADDVLDCAPDGSSSGKSVGRDIQEGKLTLPVLYACESNRELRVLVRAKVGDTAVSPGDAASILAATHAAGGVERARAKARQLTVVARDELSALPPSAYRNALAELAAHAAERTS